MPETPRNRHHLRLLGSGLALAGGITNVWILAPWWAERVSTRYEPAIPFWNYTNTLGFLTTVLLLSVLGVLLALFMLKTPRLPSLLLIVVGALATIASFAAVLLWLMQAVYLVPASVVQVCGGALGLSSAAPR